MMALVAGAVHSIEVKVGVEEHLTEVAEGAEAHLIEAKVVVVGHLTEVAEGAEAHLTEAKVVVVEHWTGAKEEEVGVRCLWKEEVV
jgi:hypothetical protein